MAFQPQTTTGWNPTSYTFTWKPTKVMVMLLQQVLIILIKINNIINKSKLFCTSACKTEHHITVQDLNKKIIYYYKKWMLLKQFIFAMLL